MTSGIDEIVEIPFPGQPPDVAWVPSTKRPKPSDAMRSFIAGPENHLVQVAVESILAEHNADFTPLVLFGPTGTGKSHMALGLVEAWKAKFPRRRVVHTSAIDFARELAEAIETKRTVDFGQRYRRAAFLVVEDLGYLLDKESAQRELLAVFDTVWNACGRLVLTMAMSPGKLSKLMPGLQARLMGGLTVPLSAPGLAARRVLLTRLAQSRGLELDTAALERLADGLCTTTPELVRALIELEMAAPQNGKPIDVVQIDTYLKQRTESRDVPLPRIAKTTAKHFSMRLTDLRSASRRRGTVLARSVAMYLGRTLSHGSFREIGLYFGGRDHTTVSHAYRKIEVGLQTDPDLQCAVEEIQEKLLAS